MVPKTHRSDRSAPLVDTGGDALAAALARRVRALRARRSLTRAALSDASGVSIAYLARLEGGQANISLAVLAQLSAALGTTPRALLAEGDDDESLDAMLALIRGQPPAVRADLLRWLRERLDGAAAQAASARARRIALIGLRGAGKSTLGARLARALGLPFVELNREIEREGGVAVPEVFTLYGASGYRTLERRCLERVIERHDAVVLATGGGLVTEPGTYALLRDAFGTVWLRARPEDHFERVRRQQDARIAAPALEAVAMANIRTMLAAREPLYSQADLRLDTSGRTVARSVAELVALLAPHEAPHETPRAARTAEAPSPAAPSRAARGAPPRPAASRRGRSRARAA